MGVASIVLGVLSMVLCLAGFLLSWVPVLGALLSFGSPVLALMGAVLGGVSLSRAKEEGADSGVPLAGLIVSIVAFFPGLLVALTCGVCNSMCTAASLTSPPPGSGTPAWYEDGGLGSVSPGITPPLPPGTAPPGTAPPGTVPPGTVQPGTPGAPPDPNAQPGVVPAPGAPPTDPNAGRAPDPSQPIQGVAPADPNAPPPAFPPPPPPPIPAP